MPLEKVALQADGPDKGGAWLVAAAVFSIHLIFGGIFRSQGIFFVEFINVYGIDRRKASIPFSLYATIRHLFGFIAGIMGQKYGCRCLVIIGGILASANTALCFFATSIEWYIVLWGVMNGLITSLTTILPHVVILQYFIKYRTTATGLGFTGGCIGSFIFPVILEALLYSYGLNGTFLLLSSIMMHAIPAAMILKSPPWSIDKNGQVTFKDHQTDKSDTSGIFQSNTQSIRESNVCKCECGPQFHYDTVHENHGVQNKLGESECHKLTLEQSPNVACSNLQCQIHKIDLQVSSPLSKKIFSSESRTCTTLKSDHCESVQSPESTETKANSANKEVVCTNISKKPANSFKHHIKAALYLHKKAIFILISCTRVTFFVSFSPVLTFIVDFAMDKGLHEEDGKFILGALSFGDILGRMCLGWITDSGYVSLPRYMFGGMMMLSACLACMPLFYSRWTILCAVALFALLQGSLYVRHPGLVGKYLNSDEQSIAMGCMDFFSGIITLFVPLYIGYFRDHIGSYDAIFYINGSLVMLTAIGWFFESRLVSSNNFQDKALSVV